MPELWSRESPQFFEVGDLPLGKIDGPDAFADVSGRMLSRDSRSGGATLKVSLPAGWSLPPAVAGGLVELFVLEGELLVDAQRAGAGGFVSLPSGTAAEVVSPSGAEAFVFWNPAAVIDESASARLTSVWQEPWQQGRLTGLPFGRMFKPLRHPDKTEGDLQGGPNGCLRLTQWLAGYAAPQEHVHSVWEELIFLGGDWLVPERDDVARAGSYLGNPAGFWHGPVATSRGVLAIVHSTKELDLTTRDYDGADALVSRYLEEAPLHESSAQSIGRG